MATGWGKGRGKMGSDTGNRQMGETGYMGQMGEMVQMGADGEMGQVGRQSGEDEEVGVRSKQMGSGGNKWDAEVNALERDPPPGRGPSSLPHRMRPHGHPCCLRASAEPAPTWLTSPTGSPPVALGGQTTLSRGRAPLVHSSTCSHITEHIWEPPSTSVLWQGAGPLMASGDWCILCKLG